MNPHKNSQIPEKYLFPLNLNGLNGRYLRIPNRRRKREIMLVYGHHSSIERYYGLADDLSQYGTLTMPDLPGFGGMDSLYSIDQEPTIDELADYLAAVVKLLYKNRHFTLAGFSIGSAIVTRMLQKYPEIADRVDLLVSVAGFTHHSDFKYSARTKKRLRLTARFLSGQLPAWWFRYFVINSLIIKCFYRFTPNAKPKFIDMQPGEFKKFINFEVELWHCNDVRTHMKTVEEMLKLELTKQKINLPVRHISLGEADQYFNASSVTKNLKKIYKSYVVDRAKMKQHMPSLIASKEDTVDLIPKASRQVLSRPPKKVS